MIIIYGIILIGYIGLWIRAKRKKIPYKSPFLAIASELDTMIGYQVERTKQREQVKQLHTILHNRSKVIELEREHHLASIATAITILFVGTLLSSILYIAEIQNVTLSIPNMLTRNEYLLGSRTHNLLAQIGEKDYELPVIVSEQKYTKEQIEELWSVYELALIESMIGENESIDLIRDNLNFQTSIAGYPFTNQWSTSNHNIIHSDGRIGDEPLNIGGETVIIYVTCSYYEYEHTYEFLVSVYPKVLTEEEKTILLLTQSLEEADKSTVELSTLQLPEVLDNQVVQWSRKREDTSMYVFALVLVASIAMVLQKKKSLPEAMKRREEQMVLDYAPMVNQLVLYLGAGMTMRKAFAKIAHDYVQEKGKEKRYVYEEIYNLCQEIDSGVSESEAYENFGRRCNIRIYLKFATLLSQNAKKGASELLQALKKEAAIALEERKSYVKVKAEQATTKLLIPMIMMLGIVMVVIMIPAFLSFQI